MHNMLQKKIHMYTTTIQVLFVEQCMTGTKSLNKEDLQQGLILQQKSQKNFQNSNQIFGFQKMRYYKKYLILRGNLH